MVQLIKVLNDTGLLDSFYTLLWTKPENANTTSYQFKIPNTIIIRDNRPNIWYFSNSKGDIIKKKNENLEHDKIISIF